MLLGLLVPFMRKLFLNDFIAKDRNFPVPEQGDFIAVECVGAYGRAMASQYNSRLRGIKYTNSANVAIERGISI